MEVSARKGAGAVLGMSTSRSKERWLEGVMWGE